MSRCDTCTNYKDESITIYPEGNKYKHSSMPITATICIDCANKIASKLIILGKCKALNELSGEAKIRIENNE